MILALEIGYGKILLSVASFFKDSINTDRFFKFCKINEFDGNQFAGYNFSQNKNKSFDFDKTKMNHLIGLHIIRNCIWLQ